MHYKLLGGLFIGLAGLRFVGHCRGTGIFSLDARVKTVAWALLIRRFGRFMVYSVGWLKGRYECA